jgi:hypothetical protein
MSDCTDGGKEHGEVLTPAHEGYNPDVLGIVNALDGPRPDPDLWGYCGDCRQGFRWSVSDQQWRPWPGGLGMLPHLQDEELEELYVAVVVRRQELAAVLEVSQNPETDQQLNYKIRILRSLETALSEARYQLWPPTGNHEPRAWGEAWEVLDQWLGDQLGGIQRSSATERSEGAALAFSAVRGAVEKLRKPGTEISSPT